ncbi:MAG TPA: LacI family DNA-binding transcriptional regulator [Ferruginibacter sp.]|nr:LacI family DNA-binding transcriptional regulator [Ferruginibacter sp.]HMP20567.1 LacI family DNA-binding transcriptional regulator [Ferruginibacter sp.]
MYEAITIKDISKALGLSTSTVSRALRGSYEISSETKKLVLEYAEKINYRPNPVALSLKGRRNCSIGVIVSEIANNFFSQAINGIESIAYNRGYHIIISQSHESYEREVVNIQHLASRSVDGLLVSLSSETKDLSYLMNMHEKGMPIVFFDRISEGLNTFKVIADNAKASYDATNHLIKKGYKRIAHITNAVNLSITKERLDGYKKALEEKGLPYNEKYVQYCNHGGMVAEEIDVAIKNLMSQKQKPDAVVTASDRITTCLLSAAKKLKLKIPENLGVVGFTNTNIPELFNPPLTTIRQPAFEMGQVATELLIKIIESKRPITEFETKILDTELTVRESA